MATRRCGALGQLAHDAQGLRPSETLSPRRAPHDPQVRDEARRIRDELTGLHRCHDRRAGMASAFAEQARQLVAKQKISEILYLYCRGVDRLDADILESVFWPDAHEEHAGLYEGGVAGLIAHLMRAMKNLRTQH